MIVGESAAIKRAKGLAERFAPTRLAILLVGPTGTGKELFAQFIHERSGREGALVDVNCCALPRDMAESLLFGHERGAFTGAIQQSKGAFERANRGTILLDELSGLALEIQGKLLRVLETRQVERLGGQRKCEADARVIGAVQDTIGRDVATGRFRRDLYHRVAGVVIELLPLAERMEDVLPLANHFAALQHQRLEVNSERTLLDHTWAGNVRELRLAIERAGQLVENGTIPAEAVEQAIALGRPNGHALSTTTVIDVSDLVKVCECNGWHADRSARALGIHRATLFRRLKRAGISLRHRC